MTAKDLRRAHLQATADRINTARELWAQGLTYREIGERMGFSEDTARRLNVGFVGMKERWKGEK